MNTLTAIFDGYWAFFVARVPGVCFGLCAAGSRLGNIVTHGNFALNPAANQDGNGGGG